jgi:hypothetical protein
VTGDDTRRLLTVMPVAQLIVSTGHGRITPCPHPVRGEGMHGTETFACPPNPITEQNRHVRLSLRRPTRR